MALFGTASPKYVINGTTVNLGYCVVLKDEPEYSILEHIDPISGWRKLDYLGYHWIYRVRWHLFKESGQSTKYEQVHSHLGSDVTLYRHNDGDPLMDLNGNNVQMTLLECRPDYFERAQYRDIVYLTFQSRRFVEIKEASTPILVTPEGVPIVIGAGEIQIGLG